MGKYIKLLRLKHGVKNVLVLVPVLLSPCTDPAAWARCAAMAACFWAAASGVYVMNDLLDVKSDRMHPTKRHRPIASGAVKPACAAAAMAALYALSAAGSFALSPEACAMVCLYVAMNLAYSRGAKNVPVLDVAILTSGFMLRAACGARAAGIDPGWWMYFCILAVSAYMVLSKRLKEASQGQASVDCRPVLRYYTGPVLQRYMGICEAMLFVFYASWAVGASAGRAGAAGMLPATLPVLCMAMFRYDVLMGRSDAGGDMVAASLADPWLVALMSGAVLSAAALVRM